MKHCTKCNVNVETVKKLCPLCGELLIVIDDKDNEVALYPQYRVQAKSRNVVFRLFLFLSIVAIIVSVFININVIKDNNVWWSGYIVASILYLWILVRHTIISKSNFASRMVIQTVSLSCYMMIIDLLSRMPNEFTLTWSIDYVIPFITIATTLIILFVIVIRKIKYKDYLIHLFSSLVLDFIPLILYFVNVIDVFWPSAAAALVSIATIIGIAIFADKETKTEIKKRFHI